MAGEPIGDAKILLGVDTSGVDAGLAQVKAKVETAVTEAESVPAAAFTAGADDQVLSLKDEEAITEKLTTNAEERAAAEAKVTQQVKKQVEETKSQAKEASSNADHALSGMTGDMSVAAYTTAIGLLATSFERLFNGFNKAAESGRHFADAMRDIEATFGGGVLGTMDSFTQKMEGIRAKQEQTYRQILDSQTLLDAIATTLVGGQGEAQAKLNKLAEESANAASAVLRQTTKDGLQQIAQLMQEVRKFKEELNKSNRFPSMALDISRIAEFAQVLAKNVEASR